MAFLHDMTSIHGGDDDNFVCMCKFLDVFCMQP